MDQRAAEHSRVCALFVTTIVTASVALKLPGVTGPAL
jgi:hypothetical protein